MQVNSDTSDRSRSLVTRITAAWILGLVVLAFSGWAGGELAAAYDLGSRLRYGIQAAIMSGLVVPGVWLLRRQLDRRPFAGLAMLGLARSLKGFWFGAGLIVVPAAITLLSIVLFGWGSLSFNAAPDTVMAIGVGFVTAFFFEALPEELLFRGYIFRNLNTVMRKWTASVTTVALFMLLPVFIVPLERHLFQMEVQIGNSDHITGGYLLTIVVFGAFLQYLRVLTETVWTGIGFHLFFLMASRGVVGDRPSSFIRVSEVTTQAPMQAVLFGSLVLCLVALLLYPRLTGRSLGWGKVDPE